MQKALVFLDLETTGLNPETDEIIEIGAVIVRDGQITDRFSTLVKPRGSVPFRITRLTGITDEMLSTAPGFDQVAVPLREFLGELTIAGHNVSFDISFLNRKLGIPLYNPVLDTMDLFQVTLPRAAGYRLEGISISLGINTGEAHRALNDAEAACLAFYKCHEFLDSLDSEILSRLYELNRGRDWQFSQYLADYITGVLSRFPGSKSAFPFAYLRDTLPSEGSLFGGRADGPRPVWDALSLKRFLEPAGPFAQKIPGYMFRPGQVDMMETVAEGFQENRHMIIEAGTGTGKSLAYLLPAISWATANGKKVVVATHTINLQEQLWNKDLPLIRDITGLSFSAALVKGRNNYLCLRRWESILKDAAALEDREILFYMKVLVWLTQTTSGDRSELNIQPSQHPFWKGISSEQDTCLGPVCPWFNKQCFVSKARRAAELADILVVNHSLLLTDVKLQNRLLPAFEYLIIDEAHHLEDSATEQLGWVISMNSLRQNLFSLTRGFKTGHSPGLFNQLKHAVRNNSDIFAGTETEKLDLLVNEAFERVHKIQESVSELADLAKTWASGENGEADPDSCLAVRVKDIHRSSGAWVHFMSAKDNFTGRAASLKQNVRKICALIEDGGCKRPKLFSSLQKDLEYHLNYLEEVNTNINNFFDGPCDHVFWIEADSGPVADVKLRSAPVSVGKLLNEYLFQTKRSTLLTSATISVDSDFAHFIRRVGLDGFPQEKLVQRQIPSPFDYDRQALLCIIRDIPDPAAVEDSEFIEYITPIIGDLCRIFAGRTLVLFTSHRMLKEVYLKVRPDLETSGITLLGHKIDGGRSRLIEEFRKNNKTVLFGASSFWEGVDLAGDLLKCVVLVRLPFAPPTSPIVEARVEELQKVSRDAFYSYIVPEAVIRLKQGFGRLIRTEGDEGIIVVLDRRIVDKRYGRKFLNSLPIKTHFRGDTATVLQKIADWTQGERPAVPVLNIMESRSDLDNFLRTARQKKRESGSGPDQ